MPVAALVVVGSGTLLAGFLVSRSVPVDRRQAVSFQAQMLDTFAFMDQKDNGALIVNLGSGYMFCSAWLDSGYMFCTNVWFSGSHVFGVVGVACLSLVVVVVVVVAVVVVVVVVVVQTRCNDEVFIHDAARDAPNYGGRVPVDTTACPVPMHRAPKSLPHIPAGKVSSWNCRSECTCEDSTGLPTTKWTQREIIVTSKPENTMPLPTRRRARHMYPLSNQALRWNTKKSVDERKL